MWARLFCDVTVHEAVRGGDAGVSLSFALGRVRGCRHLWWHRKHHLTEEAHGD